MRNYVNFTGECISACHVARARCLVACAEFCDVTKFLRAVIVDETAVSTATPTQGSAKYGTFTGAFICA